ncbi:MAG TPA: hypothetical protein VGK36_24090, partial [Candidatus Angelobacter sp.]
CRSFSFLSICLMSKYIDAGAVESVTAAGRKKREFDFCFWVGAEFFFFAPKNYEKNTRGNCRNAKMLRNSGPRPQLPFLNYPLWSHRDVQSG